MCFSCQNTNKLIKVLYFDINQRHKNYMKKNYCLVSSYTTVHRYRKQLFKLYSCVFFE